LIFDIIGVDQLYRAASSFVVPKTGQYIELGGPPAHTARQNASNIGRLLSKSYLPSLLGGGIKFNHPTYFPSKGCEKGGVLDGVHRLVEEGKIKPIIDSEFDMDDALKAYDRLMSSRYADFLFAQEKGLILYYPLRKGEREGCG
jgi:NADPH:quinone reductase-like Zn-dependent oxidoreductase